MPLFHYTRTESAFKIIDSGVIHATHWKYLNDGSEMDAVRPLLHRIFSKEFEQEGLEMIADGRMKRQIIDEHGARIFGEEAERVIDIAYRVTNKLIPVILASLCRHKDGSDEATNGLLSQWRGYGSDGGCALEFDESRLQKMLDKERDKYACMHVSLEDVEYFDHSGALEEIEVDGLARAMLRRISGDKSKENTIAIDTGMKGLQTAIARVAPKLKHSSFAEENECRIVLPCMSPEAAKEYPKRKIKQVKLRFRSGLPIPYVEIFDGKKPLPIRRIIVGPQARQADVGYTLELALKARKIDAPVEFSSIPLVQ